MCVCEDEWKPCVCCQGSCTAPIKIQTLPEKLSLDFCFYSICLTVMFLSSLLYMNFKKTLIFQKSLATANIFTDLENP